MVRLGLARAADAGDAGEGAEREVDGDVGEVVGAGAVDGDGLAVALAAFRGDGDFAAAGEVVGGEAALALEQLLERAREHHFAAVDAGAGAHVDDVVGVADAVLVMLDDEHGVAERFQALEGFEEAVVVLLVEADRGLVEDVEDARRGRCRSGRRGGCAGSRRPRACRWCGRG